MTRRTERKYDRLYRTLLAQIRTGALAPGERLPSKRTLADRAGVSLITAERAYGMLEEEGYITARERQGYFVNTVLPVSGAPAEEHPSLCLLPAEPVPAGGTAMETSVWFRTVRKVLARDGDRLFARAPGFGCSVLRNAIARYLLRYRGMFAQPRQILIGSGAEQLYECAVRLLGRTCVFGIEDPGYDRIRAAYTGMGAPVRLLPLGSDGIRAEALAAGGFDVLHVTPFHSFPSGITTSVEKRHAYLAWARANRALIIEDDYDSEFFLPGHPVASLYALDKQHAVIYINTFSKSISPAVRIGYMILPEPLCARAESLFEGLPCQVPVMDQYVLAEFISSGNFERHLNRVRRGMR